MLIIANSEKEASLIFMQVTGCARALPVTCLIGLNENYAYITTTINRIDTIDKLYTGCLSNIQSKYQDTSNAVKSIMKCVSDMTLEQLTGIFYQLLKTKYNESKPLLILFNSMISHDIEIPQCWHNDMLEHVSKFWIKYNVEHQWHIDPNNMLLLKLCMADKHIQQKHETDDLISALNRSTSRSSLTRLLNSVNYSYDVIKSFVEQNHDDCSWIVDHYHFKHSEIKSSNIICVNEPQPQPQPMRRH